MFCITCCCCCLFALSHFVFRAALRANICFYPCLFRVVRRVDVLRRAIVCLRLFLFVSCFLQLFDRIVNVTLHGSRWNVCESISMSFMFQLSFALSWLRSRESVLCMGQNSAMGKRQSGKRKAGCKRPPKQSGKHKLGDRSVQVDDRAFV